MKLEKQLAGKIALKILSQKIQLSSEETKDRFAQAKSVEYWQNLNPQLKVCEQSDWSGFEAQSIDEQENSGLLKKLSRDGYFQTAPMIKKSVVEAMREAVENLRAAGWHETFAFVYDEFWQITRTPSLIKFLSGALGNNFKSMPHVVVHYVHPETGAGWSPHIDFSSRNDRFTVWVSLSDATLDNGCMYIIPKYRVSEELLEKWRYTKPLEHKEVCRLLQSSHALPAPAGSILGWEGDVIHWGTMSSPGVEPRISLSVVYLRENVEPLEDEIPLLSSHSLPTFSQRMLSIGKALNYYSIHVLALSKFADLSQKLRAEFGEQAIAERNLGE